MQGAKGSQVLVEKVVCLCVFEHASVSAGFEEDDAESFTTFKKNLLQQARRVVTGDLQLSKQNLIC